MSIILDALRRADAERERSRGTVPGLHDQVDLPTPVPGAVDEPAEPGERRPPWVLIGALAVLLLTGLAWWLRTSQRPAPPAPVAVAEPASPAPPPAVISAAPPAPAPVAVSPSPPVVVAPAAPPVVTPPPRPTSTLKMADEAAAPPSASRPVLRYQDLPGATRAELPTLKLGGAMVSDSPGGSVLVINDQLMREGDSVVPGLLLERIGQKSARLRWKDQRFELPY
ncbi:general secretion pathway protein GspB [Ideonella sp. 4Y11]|uniref:General secretion pathway protein GspB n=1 Tax=Ideonella aquatica TaxID=2824119 RepID=A0A941BKV3_9BURK|nr:general secretion pathway protein GspB [Ideonella aquatica]MBQ0959009.1 general secretion pathway protein GspB [Ideonella aquatica]